jgi:hypothetical protein
MELKNIIYTNLNRILHNLTTNGVEFEAFYNALDTDDKKADLFNLAEEIDSELKEIQKSKLDGIIHTDFTDLLGHLQRFSNSFSSFPSNRVSEAIVLIYLINLLNESIDEEVSLNEDYDVSEFALTKLQKEIYQRNYAFHDRTTLKNSMVLLDFSDTSRIATYFVENSIPKELIIQLLVNIGIEQNPLQLAQYVLANNEFADKPNQTRSALCIHIVKSGKIIHTPYDYNSNPIVNSNRIVNQETKYQQFDDSVLILSEYNNQNDILDKYLRIYHLIENFMYKFPLVTLEKKYAGNVFSIRDFQRMHDVVNNNEITALKKLFAAICNENYSATQKFSNFIFNNWISVHPTIIADKAKIDSLLSYLRVENTFDSIDETQIPSFISKLVYAFRNSLVHNRETEFHLTHDSLLNHPQIENTAQLVLEKFVIPTIEEIVYYLIIERNDLVWFINPTIKLFDEN